MLLLIALSMAGAPADESPARRLDSAASASFTATATIIRAVGVGQERSPPPWSHGTRKASVDDSAGRPFPAIIYDFE